MGFMHARAGNFGVWWVSARGRMSCGEWRVGGLEGEQNASGCLVLNGTYRARTRVVGFWLVCSRAPKIKPTKYQLLKTRRRRKTQHSSHKKARPPHKGSRTRAVNSPLKTHYSKLNRSRWRSKSPENQSNPTCCCWRSRSRRCCNRPRRES